MINVSRRTFEERIDFPDCNGAEAGKLAKGQLQEEQGQPHKGQHDDIGQEEGTWRKI